MTQDMTKEDLSKYTFSKNNLTTSYEGTKLIERLPVQSTDTVGIQDIQKNLSDYTFNKDTDVESTNMPDTEYVPPEDDGLIPRPPEPTDEIDDAWYMKASELPEDKTIDRIEKLKKDTMQMRETIATQAKKKGVTFSKSEVDRLRGLKPYNMSEDDWLKRVAQEKQKISQREVI